MGLSEDLSKYAKALEIDFIGFSPADNFDVAPEDRKPKVYLEDALSIVSIGYKLNYTSIQNLPESRSAYMLEHDYAFITLKGQRCGLCIKACPVGLNGLW